MKASFYHEASPESVEGVLKDGLKTTKQGDRDKSLNQRTDILLDTHKPDGTPEKLSRREAIFCFLSEDDKIINITDGKHVDIKEFKELSPGVLLKVTVDSGSAFISDMNMYDTIKRSLELDEQTSTREHLATRYWERVIPFDQYQQGTIERPEVIITDNIPPSDIEIIEAE